MPFQDTDKDQKYSLRIEDASSDPTDPRNPDIWEQFDAAKQRVGFTQQLRIFRDIREIQARKGVSEGIELSTDLKTLELLRIHLLTLVWNLMLFIYLRGIVLGEMAASVYGLLVQGWFELREVGGAKAKESPLAIELLNWYTFWNHVITDAPTVFYRLTFSTILHHNPQTLEEFHQALPSERLMPRSISLLVKINNNVLPPPPPIPQPFLNADKVIQVPKQAETQSVISLRSEFFTLKSAHIAAEKVRVLTEISRFIAWSSLIPSLTHVHIYEFHGVLWDGRVTELETQFRVIADLVLNELNTIAAKAVENAVPQIVLVDVTGDQTHTIAERKLEEFPESQELDLERDHTVELCLESPRVFYVYLSDERFKKQPFNEGDSSSYPLSDLVLVTRDNSTIASPLTLFGFVGLDFENVPAAVYYSSRHRFSFSMYTRGLYYYAMENYRNLEASDEPKQGATSNSSVLSIASLDAGHYLIKFFKRVLRLRLFDLRSSDDDFKE